MFTLPAFFFGMIFGIPYWMLGLAMLLDTALLIAGVERLH